MLTDVPIFLHDVFWNWANLFWIWTVIPDTLSWWRSDEATAMAATAFVDRYIERYARHRIYRTLFVIGLSLATFFAWDEQYQVAISKSPEALSDKISALQGQLDSIKGEIWIPLTKPDIAELAARFRDAHIDQAKVGIARPDTPDCAHVSDQVA